MRYDEMIKEIERITIKFRNAEKITMKPWEGRDLFESILSRLLGWYPVVLAAAAWFDAVVSDLPIEEEQAALLKAIRESGLVGPSPTTSKEDDV